MQRITIIILLVGIALLIGTAGTVENDSITIAAGCIRVAVIITGMFAGVLVTSRQQDTRSA